MSLVLKIVAVAVGIVFIYWILATLKAKKLSASQSMLWLLAGVIVILVGLFPSVLQWAADLLGIWWAPGLLLFIAVVLLGFICFNYAREISVMKMQIAELTEQLSVLKFDLKEKNVLQDKEESENKDEEHSNLRKSE